jgi:hypothetical protein
LPVPTMPMPMGVMDTEGYGIGMAPGGSQGATARR